MLAGSLTGRSPVADAGERTRHRIGYGVEYIEKGVVPHDPPTVACLDVAIREAGPDDLDEICALIRELADFEQLSSEVVFDREVVGHHLFGPKPVARALMAEDGDPPEIAGFALWYPTFSTFLGQDGVWLEDLFVRPAQRGRGLGMALLQHLRGLSSGRVEWAVLDWNEPAIGFYRSLGAGPVKGWTRFRWDTDSGPDKNQQGRH
jgi:GNAT superfamily N-acetyltransferase